MDKARPGHRPLVGAVLALVAGTSLVACGSSSKSSSSSATTAASTAGSGVLSVQAGMNDPKDPNIAVLQYLPQSITINAGGTVEWRIAGPEPHSVTFLAPGQTLPPGDPDPKLFAPTPAANGSYDGKSFVNSGLQPLGPAAAPPFRLTFPTAGKFTFVCIIHAQMTGTVTVVDKGAKADTQATVDARSTTEANQWLDEGRAAKAKLLATPPASTKNADGTTTWKVEAGASTAHTDVLAFSPASPTVKVGDTVTFVNNSDAPHTASFAGSGTLPMDPTDPAVQKPSPGPSPQTLTATGVFNSGLLPPNAPPGAGPPEAARSFSFVVKAAGNYSFICIFHIPSGMAGALKVA